MRRRRKTAAELRRSRELKREVAALEQAIFPSKPLPPGQWTVGDMNTTPVHTSELKKDPMQDFGFGLPFDQVREAVRFWLASKGVYVVDVKR